MTPHTLNMITISKIPQVIMTSTATPKRAPMVPTMATTRSTTTSTPGSSHTTRTAVRMTKSLRMVHPHTSTAGSHPTTTIWMATEESPLTS